MASPHLLLRLGEKLVTKSHVTALLTHQPAAATASVTNTAPSQWGQQQLGRVQRHGHWFGLHTPLGVDRMLNGRERDQCSGDRAAKGLLRSKIGEIGILIYME